MDDSTWVVYVTQRYIDHCYPVSYLYIVREDVERNYRRWLLSGTVQYHTICMHHRCYMYACIDEQVNACFNSIAGPTVLNVLKVGCISMSRVSMLFFQKPDLS